MSDIVQGSSISIERSDLRLVVEYLEGLWDVGPADEGWQSDKLMKFVAKLQALLNAEAQDDTARQE